MSDVKIRLATTVDAETLLAIYKPYVEDTAISFEHNVPALDKFKERIIETQEKHPFIIAELNDVIYGYAYVSAFKAQPAYIHAVETSVYVSKDARKKGIGSALYKALENILIEQNYLNMNASIAYAEVEDETLHNGSKHFHEKLGYKYVGKFNHIGFKFNRWYSMIWMKKSIGDHLSHPKPVKKIDEVKSIIAKKYGIL